MTIPDNIIRTLLISSIILYLLALSAYFLNFHSIIYILFINSVSSFSILLYWILKQFHITQHYFELSEMVLLFFEFLFLILSVYGIFCSTLNKWHKIINYGIFGIHFIVLVLFLVFMMTFKLKRLI